MYSPSTKSLCWWCFLTEHGQTPQVSCSYHHGRMDLLPGSSVLSAAWCQPRSHHHVLTATLPVGYSPPIPIPTTILSASQISDQSTCQASWSRTYRIAKRCRVSVPIPLSTSDGKRPTTHIKALMVPCAPGPLEAAARAEKTKTIAVQSNIPN